MVILWFASFRLSIFDLRLCCRANLIRPDFVPMNGHRITTGLAVRRYLLQNRFEVCQTTLPFWLIDWRQLEQPVQMLSWKLHESLFSQINRRFIYLRPVSLLQFRHQLAVAPHDTQGSRSFRHLLRNVYRTILHDFSIADRVPSNGECRLCR